jgi:hypothetical protein
MDPDGDGDSDVFSASNIDNTIALYKNLGGGVFGPQQPILVGTNHNNSMVSADLDGDGDLDLLTASTIDSKIVWSEDLGAGAFGFERVIASPVEGVVHLGSGDFDLDGDVDVVASVSKTAGAWQDDIVWFENFGSGNFGPPREFGTTATGGRAVFVADLDSDSDLDVLYAGDEGSGDEIYWYENRQVSDCNGNGIFDSLELAAGTSLDCNNNGVLDECDLALGTSVDCDLDGIPDECGTDCNGNGIADTCDLLAPDTDLDGDGVLDACSNPPFKADVYEISLSAGGVQTFTLNGPSGFLNMYLLLGSVSGTSPGIPSGSFTVPLNLDPYFTHTLALPNTPPLTASLGFLSFSGQVAGSSPTFALPPSSDPSLVGLTLHHAYVVFGFATGNLSFVSYPAPLHLVP